MNAKKSLAVAALALAGVAGAAGVASADSGTRQDDLAPHSTAPVNQGGLVNINGDTAVDVLGDINAPVNVPVGGAKTGPQQVGGEDSAPQVDAPVHEHHKTGILGLPL